MRKSKYSEEQIIGFLKQAEAGMPVAEICRKGGFSDATFYKWRSGLEVDPLFMDTLPLLKKESVIWQSSRIQYDSTFNTILLFYSDILINGRSTQSNRDQFNRKFLW